MSVEQRNKTAMTLGFSIWQWQLIAVACARVKPTSLIDSDGSKIAELRSIAKQIAQETGKDR